MRLRYYKCSCCNKQNHNIRTCIKNLDSMRRSLDVWKKRIEKNEKM